MNYLDITLGIFLILGIYKGLKNGLLIEVASLVALILGVYGAIYFSYYAVDYLSEKVDWSEQTINLAAFALTFIIIVLVIIYIGKALTKVASLIMLGIVNKILGGLFGLLKVAFILSVVLMFISEITDRMNLIDEETKENSILYQSVQPLAPLFLPRILREVKELDKPGDTENQTDALQVESV